MSENGRRFEGFNDEMDDAEEVRAAQALSERIDRVLAGHLVDSDEPELAVAQQLSRLNDLLPSPDPAFERRVMDRSPRRERRWPALRLPALRTLGLAAAVTVILLAFVLTVPGQTALARLAAIFELDSVQVGVNVATATPTETARVVAPRVERPLDDVAAAADVAPVPILVPESMPAGWTLRDVRAVYYPDLPAEVPLNIILVYGSPDGASLEITEYFVQLGDNLAIDSLSRSDESSRSAEEVTIDGRRAILVKGEAERGHHALIWQQDGVLLEVDAVGVNVEELLAIVTSSMRPVE